MAGDFDDLIPGSVATTGGGTMGGESADSFADLLPTPEQTRSKRLRQIALTSMKNHSGEPGAGDLFSDNFTLGLMRPVGGLASALGGEVGEMFGGEPASLGERYKAQTGAYDDYLAEGGKNSGWGGTAASVAGSLTSGGPARGVVTEGLWPMIKSATGMGAVEGAARNSDSPTDALGGAVEGGAVAGATTGIFGGMLDMIKQALPAARRARQVEREANRGTPPDVIKQQSRALFKQLDDAGVAYNPTQTHDLLDALQSDLRQNGHDPQGVHKDLNGVLARLEALRNQPMSLETLQQIREQVSSNAGAMEPQVRRIAGRILGQIDGFVTHTDPALSQIPGDQVAPLWTEARRLWRTASVADDMGWRLDKADRRSSSTGSGANIDNPIRQNVRGVLDRATQPGRFNPYNAAEIAQMERVVDGSTTQNLLRDVGNRLGGGGPLGTATNMGVGGMGGAAAMLHGAEPNSAMLLGGALGAGSFLGGKAARNAADKMSQNEGDALVRLISTGSLDQAPKLVSQNVPTRAALARILAQQSLGSRAGAYAGGEASR